MTGTTKKTVVLLAFANDRNDTVGYLRNLPDEAKQLRDATRRGLPKVDLHLLISRDRFNGTGN